MVDGWRFLFAKKYKNLTLLYSVSIVVLCEEREKVRGDPETLKGESSSRCWGVIPTHPSIDNDS